MVIIYGRRSFGRIDAHGGEHAQTSFAHVYYMPIVPISSFWVTQDLGTAVRGFEIRASGKSILAAYLRSWGPIAALIAFVAAPGALGLVAAVPFVAATVWAWTLRSLRGDAIRRSDFQLLAFGTRCDPERMPRELRARVKASLEERWQKLDPGRPPDDVARFGPRSRDEAVIAFGLLRLAAVELANADARAAAKRILDGQRDAPTTADSPYRGDVVASAEVLDDVAAAAATRTAAAAAAAREIPAPRAPWWRYTGRKSVLVAFVVLAALGGVIEEGPSLLGAQRYGAAELMQQPDRYRYVEVDCEHVERIGTFAGGTPAYACAVGDRVVPVAGEVDGSTVVGKLHRIDDSSQFVWPRDVRSAPDTLDVFLEVKSPTGSRIAAILCLLVLAAAGVLGVRWLFRRNR